MFNEDIRSLIYKLSLFESSTALELNTRCFHCGKPIAKVYKIKGVPYGQKCVKGIIQTATHSSDTAAPKEVIKVLELVDLLLDGWDLQTRENRNITQPGWETLLLGRMGSLSQFKVTSSRN